MNGLGSCKVSALDRARGRYEGNGGAGRSHEWPSKVLHDVGPQMGKDGIDRRRLEALAGFIEGLPMAGGAPDGQARVPLKYVDSKTPVVRFHLQGGPQGFGFIDKKDAVWLNEYGLTAYGLCCWAWGANQGMSAVARNGRVNEVHAVWTAEPVLDRRVRMGPSIEPRHVADALRHYCKVLDAVEAWKRTATWAEQEPRPPVATVAVAAVEAAPAPVPVPEPEPEPGPVEAAHAAYVAAVEERERAEQAVKAAESGYLAARLLRGDDPHAAFREVYGG